MEQSGDGAPRTDGGALWEHEVASDPLAQFHAWLADATARRPDEPIAMALATASADGVPAVRMVLLKGADERGFVFYTNYESDKARDLAANPRVALLFYWPDLGRQVRIVGDVAVVSEDETAAYFASRPRASRLGTWASDQSRVIASRGDLEASLATIESRFAQGDVPPPPYWGGCRVTPESYEFWLGRDDRLHDRLRYRKGAAGAWSVERLAP